MPTPRSVPCAPRSVRRRNDIASRLCPEKRRTPRLPASFEARSSVVSSVRTYRVQVERGTVAWGSSEGEYHGIRRHFQPRPAAMRTWALNGRNPGAHRNGADT
eukprot:5616838-Prymnesium_polylepis.2